MSIYLTAILNSKKDCITEVKQVLENMVIETRKEPACIKYDLHQGIEDKTLFVFYEIWADERGLALHNEQPYIKAFGELAKNKLQGSPLVYLTHKLME